MGALVVSFERTHTPMMNQSPTASVRLASLSNSLDDCPEPIVNRAAVELPSGAVTGCVTVTAPPEFGKAFHVVTSWLTAGSGAANGTSDGARSEGAPSHFPSRPPCQAIQLRCAGPKFVPSPVLGC